MKFTFAVLAFNQENLIMYTLESVKYQVINYAEELEVDLIVIDDCSKDNTVKIVGEWIDQNGHYFNRCRLIQNEINRGTVNNYNKIIDLIEEGEFKFIAGDDLFTSKNVFESFCDLDDSIIKTYFPLYFKDDYVYFERKRVVEFMYSMLKKRNKTYNLKSIRKGCYLHTPSTLYTKGLYTRAKCKELNSKFRLFEDDPTWYSMIKNIDDLSVEFKSESIILYRIHSSSVSNSINPIFMEELLKLNSIYLEDTKGIERFLLKSKGRSYVKKYFSIFKMVGRISYLYKYMKVCNKKEYKEMIDNLKKRVKIEQHYYNKIKKGI